MPTKNILSIQEYKQIEGEKRWKKYAMQAITKAELKWLYQYQKKQTLRHRLLTEIKNSTKVLIYGQSIRKKQQL